MIRVSCGGRDTGRAAQVIGHSTQHKPHLERGAETNTPPSQGIDLLVHAWQTGPKLSQIEAKWRLNGTLLQLAVLKLNKKERKLLQI